jgi:hypothetical protein
MAGGARYIALQAGVQLANRAGPSSEIEFPDFVVRDPVAGGRAGWCGGIS